MKPFSSLAPKRALPSSSVVGVHMRLSGCTCLLLGCVCLLGCTESVGVHCVWSQGACVLGCVHLLGCTVSVVGVRAFCWGALHLLECTESCWGALHLFLGCMCLVGVCLVGVHMSTRLHVRLLSGCALSHGLSVGRQPAPGVWLCPRSWPPVLTSVEMIPKFETRRLTGLQSLGSFLKAMSTPLRAWQGAGGTQEGAPGLCAAPGQT